MEMSRKKKAYFAVLGRVPALSLVELFSLLSAEKTQVAVRDVSRQCVVWESEEIDERELQEKSAGIVKVGRVVRDIPTGGGGSRGVSEIVSVLEDLLEAEVQGGKTEKKYSFGISVYEGKGKNISSACSRLAFSLKQFISSRGVRARYVQGKQKGKPLSSAAVVFNGLMGRKGSEFVVLRGINGMWIGKTTSVQRFQDFSSRDYGRPGRDTRRGMLPPKLARMMVHIAQVPPGGVIGDPFCGIGTVLQEALCVGYRALGSDIEERAVQECRRNIAWLENRRVIPAGRADVRVCDARALSSCWNTACDAVVTEPYLGPPGGISGFSPCEQQDAVRKLQDLYHQSLIEIARVVRQSVVFAFPFFKSFNSFIQVAKRVQKESDLSLVRIRGKLLSFLSSAGISEKRAVKLFPELSTHSILYRRPGQAVGREIVVFRKNDGRV